MEKQAPHNPAMPYPQPGAYQPPPPPYGANPQMQSSYPQQHQPMGFQQPGFQPTQQTNTAIFHAVNVGPDPTTVICPSCHTQIVTKLDYETSSKTHMFALILCCCICWPCAWIPYVMDSCKNANHYCPKCDAFIGTYSS